MATVDCYQRKLGRNKRLSIPPTLRVEFASLVAVNRVAQKYLHLPEPSLGRALYAAVQGNDAGRNDSLLNAGFRIGKAKAPMDPQAEKSKSNMEFRSRWQLSGAWPAVRAGKQRHRPGAT